MFPKRREQVVILRHGSERLRRSLGSVLARPSVQIAECAIAAKLDGWVDIFRFERQTTSGGKGSRLFAFLVGMAAETSATPHLAGLAAAGCHTVRKNVGRNAPPARGNRHPRRLACTDGGAGHPIPLLHTS